MDSQVGSNNPIHSFIPFESRRKVSKTEEAQPFGLRHSFWLGTSGSLFVFDGDECPLLQHHGCSLGRTWKRSTVERYCYSTSRLLATLVYIPVKWSCVCPFSYLRHVVVVCERQPMHIHFPHPFLPSTFLFCPFSSSIIITFSSYYSLLLIVVALLNQWRLFYKRTTMTLSGTSQSFGPSQLKQ